MHAGFFRLSQCHLHDFFGDALDFDVHLQRGHAIGGTSHLEVHVTQVIFVTQNVGQHGKTVAILDQTHRNASHMRRHGHTGIHQRQATTAHRSHRRRTVGLGHLRHHTHGVGELFFGWQCGHQSTLGQAAMTDFTALGRTEAASFACGKGRHVVVQHEAVFKLASQGINALGIAVCAQCGHHQSLGFTTGEQAGAVGAGQHAVADFNGTHGAGIAAINAGLTSQNLAAHDAGFDVEQHAFDLDTVKLHAFGLQAGHHGGIGFAASLGTGLLVADLVGSGQFVAAQGFHLGNQHFVASRSLPIPHGFASLAHQVVDGGNGNVALLMAIDHCTQHHFFGQLLGFRFHHQHSGLGTGHHQIHLAVFELGLTGIEHVFTVDVTHAGGTDRAIERNAGNRQCRTGCDHGRNVSLHLGIQTDHMHDDLHFVVEAFGKQGADGAVDQAAGECFQLAGAAFALEKAAGNLASGVGFFGVVHGQREKVLASLGIRFGDHRGQHHGAVHVQQHSAGGLAGNFARFHGDGVLTPLEGFGDFVEHAHENFLVEAGLRTQRRSRQMGD